MLVPTGCHEKKRDLGMRGRARTQPGVLIIVGMVVLALSGCGGGGTSATPSFPPVSATPSRSLKAIVVSPANSSIIVPANVQLTAMGTFSDGSTQNLTTSASWSSSATSVATVTNEGLAVGAGVGNTTITATSGAVSGSATLAVGGSTTITATLGGVRGSTSLTVTPPAPGHP